jgi:hypothetical protein
MTEHALSAHVGRIVSRMGASFPGSHAVFRGKDLHAEFADAEWMDLFLYGITGRRLSAPQLKLLQAVWTYASSPDARLWNNRVVALAGTARSTGYLGMAAGLAVSEARIYGGGIDLRAIDFLQRTRVHLDGGGELGPWVRRELTECRSVAGYGRPVATTDERNEPLLRLARELGLASGPYLKLAHDIEDSLLASRMRLHLNYSGVVAALVADIGMTPREYHLYMFPSFLAGMVPCYLEALENPAGTFLPLPCTAVEHRGVGKRTWPGARAG